MFFENIFSIFSNLKYFKNNIDILKNSSKSDFMNKFCQQIDKINFILYIMIKSYKHIEVLVWYRPLSKKALFLYKNNYFIPL